MDSLQGSSGIQARPRRLGNDYDYDRTDSFPKIEIRWFHVGANVNFNV